MTTILSRKTIFEGHAFNVEKLQVRLPDGRERAYDLVDHKDSVTILPLEKDGSIWFVSQYRMGSESHALELPAGVMDAGETPETAADRELREEIGLAAGRMRLLGSVYLAPGYSKEKNYIFLAADLVSAPLEKDEDEFLDIKNFSAAEIREMIANGSLADSKSLAALLLARSYLE